MRRRIVSWLTLSLVLAVIASLAGAGGASADIAPPWCGTPEPDSAEDLPPENSFPHIPYYAIGCTLEDIRDRSNGRMSLEVIGQSVSGRDMYGVVIDSRATRAQRDSSSRLREALRYALDDPERAQDLVERRDVKVPIFVQGSIHGNEYEGVDANMRAIERLATTPYGEDPEVDRLLDHAVVVFNVIQNPDGRVAGTRANGNGFVQSPETSVCQLRFASGSESSEEPHASVLNAKHAIAKVRASPWLLSKIRIAGHPNMALNARCCAEETIASA